MAPSKIPERAIQRAIVDYIAAVAPEILCFAIPNSSVRTAGGRAGNAVSGLTAGIPDLALVLPGGRVAFIEVKTADGQLSVAQRGIMKRLIWLEAHFVVARDVEDVREALRAWKVHMREHIHA